MLELGEITHLKKGSPITKKDTVQGNIPVIAGGQSPAYYHNQANRTGRIITVSASGAYAGFVNYFETPIFASDCTTVEPKDIKKLDAKYLFWMMRSKQDEIYRLQQGGGQPHVYSKDLSRIKIPLPPLSVQQEIVEELDRYQRIIDGAKQVVVNYKANINIQGDWEWKPLSDFCNIQGGHAFKSDGFVSEGVQLIRMGNVKQDFFDQTNKQVFLPKIYLEKYTNYALTRGDIIISMTGTVGKDDYANVCRIDKDSNYLLNQRVSKLVIDVDKVDPDYFYLCVISPFFKKQVIANSSGGVRQANVSATGIAKATIPFPPLDVQKEIALSLNSERKIVDQNNILITAFEIKIKSRIAEICGVVD
jgi:type I restriction enzyme M protein